ncbi:hypothetical protein KIW84_065550 [Lathyrus oleraceus]|uniref:U3 small nucleolar RNA-associated protein 10 N-terminal domain-containing protein n=1 Tax=Pisum sativum TaxID=3888 RepID=A0A9D4WFS5_PEA|nr:hypothetical protein KIW84_065550 [Pisum sativum]
MVIVQQCSRDKGVLEVPCNYASPSKKSQPSKNVIGFCTAVFIELLGTVVTVDDDIVKRILPFVVSGLQSSVKGLSDHKASSLMTVGLLGNKVALASKLLNILIRSVAEVAREEANELIDLHWFRLSLIALINLVRSQNVQILPIKALEILKELRDLPGVLLELSKEFNIEKFLVVLSDSLIDCSSKDEYCQQALLSLIEKCSVSPARLLSKFFIDEGVPAAVQVESLQCYAFLCSLSQDKWQTELLAEFPSILVPLAGDDQTFSEATMQEITKMAAAKLFRTLPCSNHDGKLAEAYDPEEEEPALEPAWSHLVYW